MSVFEVRIVGDARIVVSGELDMATSPQLTGAIEALASSGTRRVVVDLLEVTFLDSSGVSALCLARGKLGADGAVLVLGPTSGQVDAVLQIAGVDSAFVRER
jgi:anti-sigma B factor antagonist